MRGKMRVLSHFALPASGEIEHSAEIESVLPACSRFPPCHGAPVFVRRVGERGAAALRVVRDRMIRDSGRLRTFAESDLGACRSIRQGAQHVPLASTAGSVCVNVASASFGRSSTRLLEGLGPPVCARLLRHLAGRRTQAPRGGVPRAAVCRQQRLSSASRSRAARVRQAGCAAAGGHAAASLGRAPAEDMVSVDTALPAHLI
jgi:hypothetical protein